MSDKDNTKKNNNYNVIAAAFMVGVSGIAAMSGFSMGLGNAKEKDIKNYEKAFMGTKVLPESPIALAKRAFFWGSLYAISGSGLLVFGIWKLIGSPTLEEFRAITTINLPKKLPEKMFLDDANDLFEYIIEEGMKKK